MSSSKRWSAYAASGAGDGALQPGGALVGEGVEADPLLAAGAVEEEVGGDPVQPALERAGRVGVQRAEDPDEDLLGEVLGVGAVAGQAVGQAEDAVGVLLDDLVPRGHRAGTRRRGGPAPAVTAESVAVASVESSTTAPCWVEWRLNSALAFLNLGSGPERTL